MKRADFKEGVNELTPETWSKSLKEQVFSPIPFTLIKGFEKVLTE